MPHRNDMFQLNIQVKKVKYVFILNKMIVNLKSVAEWSRKLLQNVRQPLGIQEEIMFFVPKFNTLEVAASQSLLSKRG